MSGGDNITNLLSNLMAQVGEIDLDITPSPDGSKVAELVVPGLEMSKIFAIVEFAFRSHGSDTGILDGIDMMSREEAKKTVVSLVKDARAARTSPALAPAVLCSEQAVDHSVSQGRHVYV